MDELIDAHIQPSKPVAFPADQIFRGSMFEVEKRTENDFVVRCVHSKRPENVGQKFDIRFDEIAGMRGNLITLSDAFYNR